MADPRAEEILAFWFGAGDDAARQKWFVRDPAFDDAIRARFETDVERAIAGALDEWIGEPRSALALVILLDQFPRNLYRNSERAFAGDDRALRVVRDAIAAGYDRQLLPVEAAVLYLPLMHAEDREI